MLYNASRDMDPWLSCYVAKVMLFCCEENVISLMAKIPKPVSFTISYWQSVNVTAMGL